MEILFFFTALGIIQCRNDEGKAMCLALLALHMHKVNISGLVVVFWETITMRNTALCPKDSDETQLSKDYPGLYLSRVSVFVLLLFLLRVSGKNK